MSADATQYVLAIDLGSGGPKVALVSNQGELLDSEHTSTGTLILPDGGAEQDPEEWWSAICAGARAVLSRQSEAAKNVIAVACASQWSVTVPVNAEGRHLMNAVHWMDSRGARYTKAVTRGLIRVSGYGLRRLIRWLRSTGGVPTHSGADALAHILFIKNDRPDIYRQTHAFLEPMDYINLRLTGRIAATHSTIFPYLLTNNRDNQRIDYDPLLLKWSGIDRRKLPELLPVDAVLGPILPDVADDWGLARGTQVVVGAGDSQAATIGSGAVTDYQGYVCIGTSSWLSCHVPFKKTNLTDYLATMPGALRGRNMVVAEQGAAGKCLELFVDRWLFADHQRDGVSRGQLFQQVERLASHAPPGSRGLLFLPWLNGAGPPSGDGQIRGGFLNQSLRTTREEALRSVLEGVAMNVRWVMPHVERFIRRKFDRLHFIGGAARMDLWCQILADVLDRPIDQVAAPSMAITKGVALSALVALKRLRPEEIPAKVKIARTFMPDPASRLVYDKQFAEYIKSYESLRGVFHRLNATGPPRTTLPID